MPRAGGAGATPHTSRRRATVVAGSLLSGLVAAIALAVFAFAGSPEYALTGALLLGFAFGWALLGVLSTRLTDQPHRWAATPAAAMAATAGGLIVLAPGESALTTLGWVWPPLLLALVIWMTRQARRLPASRTRPVLLYPVFAMMAIIAVGGAYETLSSGSDAAVADTTGHRLIDVGGHRLDIRCAGSGSPTVVLEPGLGESASAMSRWIMPGVARTTRVCAYDQAGHGRSDAASANRADAARDLHVLLQRSGVPGRYIIAGHSLGGAIALSYAHRYPTEVAGLVLIDSMHPKQTNAFAGMDPLLALVPTLARTGLGRLLFNPDDGNPVEQARQFARDVADMPAELSRAAKLTSLGDRPVAVVTAGKDYQPDWLVHQRELAQLSRNAHQRIVAGSTHQSLIDDKTDAAQSIRAIRDVVHAVRQSGGR
jgi:pimeloyl-ACP methyl ester carboxylesterase